MKVFARFILLGIFFILVMLNSFANSKQIVAKDSTYKKIDSLIIQLQNLYKENFDSAQVFSNDC
jgi:hypothetical protein